MRKVLLSEPDLHARVFQFPNSALRQNDRKINYFDFISKGDDPECASALKRIFLRIDLSRIRAFIDKVEPLSDLQREFYKTCNQAGTTSFYSRRISGASDIRVRSYRSLFHYEHDNDCVPE